MKTILIGGGIVGSSAALELADRGHHVVLLEQSEIGAEASSAAAGTLGAQVELKEPSPLLSRFVEARTLMRRWTEQLTRTTDLDVGFLPSGVLRVGKTETEMNAIATHANWQRAEGVRTELVDARSVRAIIPELADDVIGGAWFEDDAQVEPQRLMRAIRRALELSTVSVHERTRVTRLILERGRCIGVETTTGSETKREFADAIVVTAGAWSGQIGPVPEGATPTLDAVRGEMVELAPASTRARVVYAGRGYVVFRSDGRAVCGSTAQEGEWRREVTAGGVGAILSNSVAFFPELADAPIRRMWSNFRPFCKTAMPFIGPTELPGLYYSTGHHRHGILLSRQSAIILADALDGNAR